MVSFRKSLMAVALLALCAGLASAQVQNNTSTAILRAEGVTEPVNTIDISTTAPATAAGVTGTYAITLYSTSVPITSFPGTKADGSDNGIQLTTNVPNDKTVGGTYPGTIAAGGGAVSFQGVKILSTNFVPGPPATNAFAFTITGVRVNASMLVSGGPAFASGVSFTLLAQPADITSPAGLFNGSPIYNVANAAYAIPTLGFDVNRNVTGDGTSKAAISFAQCDTTTNVSMPKATPAVFTSIFSVKFTELFSKSFQTLKQEGPNATNGTRLSATFSGFPANTQLWVPIFVSSVKDPLPGPQATAIQAVLVVGDDADGSGGKLATPTDTPALWVAVTSGTPVVYEITQAFPGTSETVEIPVAVAFTGVPTLTPAAAGTVIGNYAPQSTMPGAVATAPIPRFTSTGKTSTGFFSVAACSTSLLFPYITTVPGWNVGIAISNTGTDPFGNMGQAGTCDFSFYGATGAPAAPMTLGANGFGTTADRTAIKSGTTSADLASVAVAGGSFTGYAIAVCNFQYAHGYAFIIGNGAKSTLSNGYLALVLQSGAKLTRPGTVNGQWEQIGN